MRRRMMGALSWAALSVALGYATLVAAAGAFAR
jgi:hypothetical protein